jgi:hypothetical protein
MEFLETQPELSFPGEASGDAAIVALGAEMS